jgi:hypothetical protein
MDKGSTLFSGKAIWKQVDVTSYKVGIQLATNEIQLSL